MYNKRTEIKHSATLLPASLFLFPCDTIDNTMETETFAFQAEINQLLSLIINAFYSNKDVFLRELISNAADALDKVRYNSLTKGMAVSESDVGELAIWVKGDRDAMTLTIEDTGIGMSQAELVKNLGTIAHSGTRAFMEAVQAGNADVSLIGQFGVGFYSAFLVADRVEVYSRAVDSSVVNKWESAAGGTFSVSKVQDGDEGSAMARGTRIILHLKEGMGDYADVAKIKEIIKRHSEYCTFPIYVWTKKTREEDIIEEQPSSDDKQDAEAAESGDGVVEEIDGSVEDDADAKKTEAPAEPPKKRTVEYHEYDHVNKVKPVWQRRPDEVTDEEHEALFKSLSGDWEPPLAHKMFEAEGSAQFKAVLYVPKNSPVDMFNQKRKKNIKLYVKKVFVSDDADQMVPDWLNFVHGIVDSDDLPLNVSREMLQQNKIMGVIKKTLVKRCLELIADLSKDETKYAQFYKKFNKNLKLGVHADEKYRDKLLPLLRFATTAGDKQCSLDEYVERMKDGQEHIYFITAETVEAARSSPCIEKLIDKGYEVLLLTDPMDEYMVQVVNEYAGKRLACCSRVGLTIPGEASQEDLDKEHADLLDKFKAVLGPRVHRVSISNRLVQSPCVLVTDAYGWTANMERIVKSQALRDSDDFMHQYMVGKRIFEINVDHPIIKNIKWDDDADAAAKTVDMAYKTSLLSGGFAIEDPCAYAALVFKMMQGA